MCEVGVIRFEESGLFLCANNLTDSEAGLISRTLVRLAETRPTLVVTKPCDGAMFQPLIGEDDARSFERCSGMTLGSERDLDPEGLVEEGYPVQVVLNGLKAACDMSAHDAQAA